MDKTFSCYKLLESFKKLQIWIWGEINWAVNICGERRWVRGDENGVEVVIFSWTKHLELFRAVINY
jgi:hypothetical protein